MLCSLSRQWAKSLKLLLDILHVRVHLLELLFNSLDFGLNVSAGRFDIDQGHLLDVLLELDVVLLCLGTVVYGLHDGIGLYSIRLQRLTLLLRILL